MVVLYYHHGTINYYLTDLSLIGPVHLKIDALSSIFILVINFTVLTSSFYSLRYFKSSAEANVPDLHLVLFILLHTVMLLVCMVQDLLPFILLWEIVALFSFLQILFDSEALGNTKAALHYFIQMHLNVVLLIVAVVWLYHKTGIQNFDALHFYFSSSPNFLLFILFFLSFGMNAGFVPLHSWFSKAAPSIPSPSAGLLSGATLTLGIYGIFRVLMYVETDLIDIELFVYCISIIVLVVVVIYFIRRIKVKPNTEVYVQKNVAYNFVTKSDEHEHPISLLPENIFTRLTSIFKAKKEFKMQEDVKPPVRANGELKTEIRYILYAFLFITIILLFTIADIIK